eukprot:COSAG01_NODE_28508_length_659_cov_1.541071_1_plen_130_part_10
MFCCIVAGNPSKTQTKAFAFTNGISERPCCYPGHCTDSYLRTCNWCTCGFKVLSEPRCREGVPPCEADSLQVSTNPNAYIKMDEMAEGSSKTVKCPSGLTGQVHVTCQRAKMVIDANSCSSPSVAVAASI